MKLVGIILLALTLAGCAGSKMEPTKTTFLPDGSTVVEQDPLAMAEDKRMLAVLKCEEARKAEAESEARKVANTQPFVCPQDMSEVACMGIMFNQAQAKTTEAMMSMVGKIAGKGEPTCADIVGTGLFDYKIAEVKEMNKTARHYGDAAAGGLKSFMLGLFGIKAVENAGDEIHQQVNGDENSPSVAGRTTSNKEGTTIGEDSPVDIAGEDAAPGVAPAVPGVETVDTVDTVD